MHILFSIMLTVGLVILTSGCGKKETATSGSDTPKPGESPNPKAGFGLANLDGTYEMIGMYIFGKWITEEELKADPETKSEDARKFVFKGDKMTSPTIGGKTFTTSTIKLDPAKTPAQIDFIEEKGKGKETTQYGIYKIEGDVLTILRSRVDKPESLPKDFTPTKDVLIFKVKRK